MDTKLAQKGSALLTVLWLTAALSAIGVAVAHNVRGETERAGTNVEDVKAVFLARAGIDRALLYRQWGGDYFRPFTSSYDFDFPAGQVHVDMIPESARLGANTATPEQVVRLLLALGEPEDRATEIATAIIDWRTPADREHPGLFEGYYLSRTPSFLPPHSSFRENEEMLLVRGITPDLYYGTSLEGASPNSAGAGLRDCLSVSSAGGVLDINFARKESMIALGLSPQDAEAIVARRKVRPFVDYNDLAEAQQALGPAGSRLSMGGQSMLTFRATSRVRQADGKLSDMRRTVGAQVKYFQPGNVLGKPPGAEIVRWFERG